MIPPSRRSRGRRWRERNRAEKTSLEVALRCSSCAPDWEHRRGLEEEVDVARRVKRVPERVCVCVRAVCRSYDRYDAGFWSPV